MLEVSLCGSSLMASGSHGGLRIYETKEWTWESWPRFGRDAPVNAAAWSGPPPLSSESLRTLVLSLSNDTTLHVLRVGRRSAGGPSSEYIGHIELSHLCPSLSENGNNGESSSQQQLCQISLLYKSLLFEHSYDENISTLRVTCPSITVRAS